MQPRDVETVARFNVAMAFETESLSLQEATVLRGVRALLEDPSKGLYFVAEQGDDLVGQVMVTTEWSDWRCAYWWWIQSVYVLPQHRLTGVFRRLYAAVKSVADSRGDVHGLRLYVENENHRAQATYEALGMQRGRYVLFETRGE